MRRIYAITAIGALVFSMSFPIWAGSCHAMNHASMCHRAASQQHHHCEMMMDQAEQERPAAADSATASITSLPEKCPMQCCMQDQSCNEIAVLSVSFVPRLAAFVFHIDFPVVVFTHSGFSSHTDRGPPLA